MTNKISEALAEAKVTCESDNHPQSEYALAKVAAAIPLADECFSVLTAVASMPCDCTAFLTHKETKCLRCQARALLKKLEAGQ